MYRERQIVQTLRKTLKRFITEFDGAYHPYYRQYVDLDTLFQEVGDTFHLSHRTVAALWKTYVEFSEQHNHQHELGERKTLSTEEAFIFYVAMALHSPQHLVEVGTQYGRSTRRLIDIKNHLGLATEIHCFDIQDEVKFFTADEAQLSIKDITHSVNEDVISNYDGGILFLDARPYQLIQNILDSVLKTDNWVLLIHDCASGICNPQMALEKSVPQITSKTGVWERHVLSQSFHIDDPISTRLDKVQSPTHKLRIFSTQHGLALVLPNTLGAKLRA
jgi:hypothetical protein